MSAIANIAKNHKEYFCQNCDYITSNKSDYEKHCKTIKHKNATLAMTIDDFSIHLSQMSQNEYTCKCGRTDKQLWENHHKGCKGSGHWKINISI